MLHVGHREATRLLGPELSAGPLAQLIDWAHGLSWGDERAGATSNEVIVDSLTLNDLEGHRPGEQLERTRQAHGGAPRRIGVVGV